MPKKIEKAGNKRSYFIMVRFMEKHKAVIEQAAKDAGKKTASAWVRGIVFDKCRYLLNEAGDPIEP